jgi:large subunit ribosomal protein L27e
MDADKEGLDFTFFVWIQKKNQNRVPFNSFRQFRLLSSCKVVTPVKRLLLFAVRYFGKKIWAHYSVLILFIDHDEGTKDRPYGYAVVAGIERTPLKVTKSMGKKKVAKRSKVKPFVKIVNYNHMMPTR